VTEYNAAAAQLVAAHKARQAEALAAERPWLTRILRDVASERASAYVDAMQVERISV